MFLPIILTLLFIALGLYFIITDSFLKKIMSFFYKSFKKEDSTSNYKVISSIIGVTILSVALLSTSFKYVPAGYTGHIVKKYGGSTLAPGKIIATNGELGRQAKILSEGLNFSPLLNIINDITLMKNIVIPKGKAGILIARDGKTLKGFVSRPWKDIVPNSSKIEDLESKMLEAKFFLEHNGERGPQLNVLAPSEYKLNQFLWEVQIVKALEVPAGQVAVVTSRVGEIYQVPQGETGDHSLATPVVPVGYVGIWDKPLMPNAYYQEANPYAYEITMFDTKIQTWVYAGGFTEREIIVSLSPSGEIEQMKNNIKHPLRKNAADKAVSVKSSDGWVIYIEARMQIQGEPNFAPKIVASVGSLSNIEDRVITPIFRSVLRNEAEKRKAVDFLMSRSEIEKKVNDQIVVEARKAGISVKDLRITHISIPPALLVPKKRTQLAEQMTLTYQQEKLSYDEQVKSNKVKALADQQSKLVEAQIEKERAIELKEMKRLEGEGERLYLEEVAKGQQAQVDVLGSEKTYNLKVMDKISKMLKDNPKLANTPVVYSVGGSNGVGVSDSAASILAIQELKKGIEVISRDPAAPILTTPLSE